MTELLITNIYVIMKEKIKKWMGKENHVFSILTNEKVTNRDVVYAHIGFVVFLLILGVAGNF